MVQIKNAALHTGFAGRYLVKNVGLPCLLALASLAGCRPAPPPVHVAVGVDYSASCRDQLPTYVRMAGSLPGRLEPDTDYLTVLRLGHDADEILDQKLPESSSRFRELLIDRLSGLPTVPGTRSALLWKDLGQRLQADPRPTAIVVFSDGDDDEDTPASRAATIEAARELAANPRVVSVTILGVRPENRGRLHTEFAALGDRFHLLDIREATLEPLLTDLETARRVTRR